MKPELVTRLVFNDSVILEITSGDDTTMMCISTIGEKEQYEKCVNLYSDEIDLLISALTLYKKRVEGQITCQTSKQSF